MEDNRYPPDQPSSSVAETSRGGDRKLPWESAEPEDEIMLDTDAPASAGSTESDTLPDGKACSRSGMSGPDIAVPFPGSSQPLAPFNGFAGSSEHAGGYAQVERQLPTGFSGGVDGPPPPNPGDQAQMSYRSPNGFAGGFSGSALSGGNETPDCDDQAMQTPWNESSQTRDVSPGSTPEACRVSESQTSSPEQRKECTMDWTTALLGGGSAANQSAHYPPDPQGQSQQHLHAGSTPPSSFPNTVQPSPSQPGTCQVLRDSPGVASFGGSSVYPQWGGARATTAMTLSPQPSPSVQVWHLAQQNVGIPAPSPILPSGVGIYNTSAVLPIGFQGTLPQLQQHPGQMAIPGGMLIIAPTQFVHPVPQPHTQMPHAAPGNASIYPSAISPAPAQNEQQPPCVCPTGPTSQQQWSPPQNSNGVRGQMEVTTSVVEQSGDAGHTGVMQSSALQNVPLNSHGPPPTHVPQQHTASQQMAQYFHHPAPYPSPIPPQVQPFAAVPVQLAQQHQAVVRLTPEHNVGNNGGHLAASQHSEHQPRPRMQSGGDEPVPFGETSEGKAPEKEAKPTLEARQYQMDFYKMARRRNIIAFLDTGAGKTFISVLLIKDVGCSEKKRTKNTPDRRAIFFLVPKKVLVGQQAHVLRTHTDLEVGEYCSDGGEYSDSWDKSRWAQELSRFDVLVMTPQILLTMLRHGFITMKKIALICFDECHHARKKHPYNLIMQEFYHTGVSREQLPKIFGMTASLVDKKSTISCEQGFFELQNNLASVIMTADVGKYASKAAQVGLVYQPSVVVNHLPEVERLLKQSVTRLRVCNMMYLLKERRGVHDGKHNLWNKRPDSRKRLPCDHRIKQLSGVLYILSEMGLMAAMFGLSEMLEEEARELSADQRHCKEMKNRAHMGDDASNREDWARSEFLEESLSVNNPRHLWNTLSIPGGMSAVARVIEPEVKAYPDILEDNFKNHDECKMLSWWDAAEAIALGVLRSKEKAREFLAKFKKGSADSLPNALRELRSALDVTPISNEVPGAVDTDAKLETQVIATHKVIQLFRFLMNEIVGKGGAGHDWRGMIFVEQTISAVVLEQMIRSIPELTKHFRCQSLTGHGGSMMSTAMEDKHQRRIVKLFRDGEVNLLISTSVAEEGLDITDCRLVVRFDLPRTEAAYIQSRGRARRMNSMYVMFVERNNGDMMAQIKHLQAAEESMKGYADFLKSRFSNPEADEGEDFISGSEDARHEILQSQVEGALVRSDPPEILVSAAGIARITLDGAISLIHHYCSQLPQDQYCTLRPYYLWCSEDTANGKRFQVQVTLPGNCPVGQSIIGPWKTSKREAKGAVCLLACEELYRQGELDDHFVPSILSEKDALKKSTQEMKQEAEKMMSRDWVVENPINPKILRPVEATPANGGVQGQGSQSQNFVWLHLHVVDLIQADNRVNKIEPEVVVPERIGIFTQRQIDQRMKFGLFPEQLDIDVSISYQGCAEFDQETVKQLKVYHFAILEGAYFKGKLFSSIATTAKGDGLKDVDFFDEIDTTLSLLTKNTAPCVNPNASTNKSWYILAPLVSKTTREGFMSRLGKRNTKLAPSVHRWGAQGSTPANWRGNRACPGGETNWFKYPDVGRGYEGSESQEAQQLSVKDTIDWTYLMFINERVANLRKPGARVREIVSRGDIVMSSHNACMYRVLGLRMDLNLKSSFPAKPSAFMAEKMTPHESARARIEQEVLESSMQTLQAEPESAAGARPVTFEDYYWERYGMDKLDPMQPLIECTTMKHVSILKRARNSLKRESHPHRAVMEDVEEAAGEENPATSKDASARRTNTAKSSYHGPVHVVPELMVFHPLQWNVWRSLSIFVAVTWVFESLLKVHELGQLLCNSEFWVGGGDSMVPRDRFIPDVMLLYESITSKNCQESMDYERLEFIGDALLKYVASMQLFWDNPRSNEGMLTKKREGLVSNTNLAKCFVNMNLHRYLRHVRLGDHPWRPAGCQFLDGFWVMMGGDQKKGATWFGGRSRKCSEENEQHQKEAVSVKYKTLADAMESLIGAFFVSCGLQAGIALIDRMGLVPANFLLSKSEEDGWIGGIENYPPDDPNLPSGLREFVQQQKAPDFKNTRDLSVLESTIRYQIKNKRYFMEALTHVSWQESNPPCYQRLEFLGDAVLDMMVTRYMFGLYGYTNPGVLTNLRTATVNNERLAIAAVNAQLQKFILHHSSYLQAHITDFVEQLDKSNRGKHISFGSGDRQAPKVLGDIVESLIGATYLDTSGSLEATWKVWKSMLEPFCDPSNVPLHPVTELIETCQYFGWSLVFQRRPIPPGRASSKSIAGWCDGKGEQWRKRTKSSSSDDEERFYEQCNSGVDAEFVDIVEKSERNTEQQKPRVNFQAQKSGKHAVSDVVDDSCDPDIFMVVLVDGVVKGEAVANHIRAARREAARNALEGDMEKACQEAKYQIRGILCSQDQSHGREWGSGNNSYSNGGNAGVGWQARGRGQGSFRGDDWGYQRYRGGNRGWGRR